MDGKTFRLSSGDFCTVAHDGDGGRATISVGASIAHLTAEELREVAAYGLEMADHVDPPEEPESEPVIDPVDTETADDATAPGA